MIFCSVLWQVMKAGFTISRLKRNGRVWNGAICILHQRRRQRQCHQLRRWWAQSSGMQRGWFWANSWNLGKPSLLLVMSRHCTSSVVHCAINVWTKHHHPAWQRSPHIGSNCKDRVGSSSTPLRLPSFQICEGSAAQTMLWDNGGNSESSASVTSDGWNGILQKGNFQTSRTLGEMCTKKWRLCGKIVCRLRWCIWFVNNKACYFTKNCCSWLSVQPSYIYIYIYMYVCMYVGESIIIRNTDTKLISIKTENLQ